MLILQYKNGSGAQKSLKNRSINLYLKTMFLSCKVCGTIVQDLKKFTCHHNFYHKNKDICCPSVGCTAHYALTSSFRRHYRKEHQNKLRSSSHIFPSHSESSDLLSLQSTSTCAFEAIGSNNDCVTSPDTINNQKNHHENHITEPLRNPLSKMFSSLHANPQLPNNVVDTVFKGLKDIFRLSVNPHLPSSISRNLSDELEEFSSIHKRMKYFESQGTLITPISYVVGRRVDYVKKNGRYMYEAIECEAQKIPLRPMLFKFFSMPNMLIKTLEHMEKFKYHDSSWPVAHFLQGTFWKQRRICHGEKLVLPLFLQVDDFETLNPLGSHSGIHKLGAAYISLPFLPYQHVSQLSCIFLALLYHSNDRVEFGNQVIFQPLIEQFNDLFRNGIQFDLPDFKGAIYFELALLLGDNLGIHTITGFTESFSCNFPCRMCKMQKKETEQATFEKKSLLRNAEDHQRDVQLKDISLTGVKENCIWLQVDNFDLFSQMGYDVMHDLNEGCSKYIMCSLIVSLIDKMKYFSVDTLNQKICSFQYGPDNGDKPVTLSILNLRKGNLRLSASEMSTFCRYFGVMFGTFVPRESCYWKVYITLMRVLNFAMSPIFLRRQLVFFNHLVSELCEMYKILFNETLKPKFHNLLHYASAMERFGPLRYLSSMRYEAKHRPNKLIAKSSVNRRNMTLTIARKHQLMMNDMFMQDHFNSSVLCGLKNEVLLNEAENILDKVKLSTTRVKKIYSVSWVSKCSEHFSPGHVIVTSVTEDNVHFARIHKLYVDDEMDTIIFETQPLKTIEFNDHYFAYQVQNSPSEKHTFVDVNKMQHPFVCNCTPLGRSSHIDPIFLVVLRKPISP